MTNAIQSFERRSPGHWISRGLRVRQRVSKRKRLTWSRLQTP